MACFKYKDRWYNRGNSRQEFDDEKLRSAGIRLIYPTNFDSVTGLKEGILLEAGFAQVTPNSPLMISSWMYDKAVESNLKPRDNRATDEYRAHKQFWFRKADLEIPMNENQAFRISDQDLRADYRQRYASTAALYYSGQLDFDEMLGFIATFLDRL